ncbi:MAG: NAD(P)-dependent oxidoreductase [Actinobacteria bacterium]|nr:NAD(P)-dependent oxidoreductase [Actinomycetota bacterium]
MKIALIGATGYVGSNIRDEALRRGHEVTAIVRHPEKLPEQPSLTPSKTDIRDVDALAQVLAGHDVVISAFSADKDSQDKFADQVSGGKAIIQAAKKAGIKRLLFVGGAGSLEVAPGQQLIDQPDFPPEWKAGAGGTREILHLLKREPELDWSFLSPAAMLEPGERTAKFRLGGDQVLVDEKGECRISVPDYAVAMIDEAEEPRHIRKRFCVAY